MSATNDSKPRGPWLSTEQAAAYLGLSSEKALRERVRRGVVRAYNFGRSLRFSQAELDEVMTPCLASGGTARTVGGGGK